MFNLKKRSQLLAAATILLAIGFALGATASLSPKEARKTIASIPGFEFDPSLVRIKSITPAGNTGGAGTIVEAEFNTAYRLEKKAQWQVAEMRFGNGRWESVELIATAIRIEKIKRTREQLQQLSNAIGNYQRDNGYYPRAKEIVELTDLLVPRYMNGLIRSDLWSTYLQYNSDGKTYRLQSLGPDSKASTGDEITVDNGQLAD